MEPGQAGADQAREWAVQREMLEANVPKAPPAIDLGILPERIFAELEQAWPPAADFAGSGRDGCTPVHLRTDGAGGRPVRSSTRAYARAAEDRFIELTISGVNGYKTDQRKLDNEAAL